MRWLILTITFSFSAWAQSPDAQVIQGRLNSAPSNCESLLAPVRGNVSLNTSPELREEVLTDLVNKASTNCLRTLAQNLAFSNTARDRAQIVRIVAKISLDTTVNYNPVEFMCSTGPSGIDTVLGLAKDAKRVTSCSPANVGEWKVVNESRSPTGVSAKYSLFHQSADQWVAAVAIDVKSGEGVASENMHRRIRQCIDAVNPNLKGSDGRQLNIQILSRTEAQQIPSNKRPPVNTIDMRNSGGRSDSANYAVDASCSTIVHEVLHLLGLCDEYDGKNDGYQCRSVPEGISIMKYHWDVFDQAVTRQLTCSCVTANCANIVAAGNRDAVTVMSRSWAIDPINNDYRNKYCKMAGGGPTEPLNTAKRNFVTKVSDTKFRITHYFVAETSTPVKMFPAYIDCECPAGNTECARGREQAVARIPSADARECPGGTKENYIQYGGQGRFALADRGFTLPVKALPSTSVLLPVHFDRITGGACEDVTPTYNECAQWAYKGSANGNDCSGKPAACNSSDWMK